MIVFFAPISATYYLECKYSIQENHICYTERRKTKRE